MWRIFFLSFYSKYTPKKPSGDFPHFEDGTQGKPNSTKAQGLIKEGIKA